MKILEKIDSIDLSDVEKDRIHKRLLDGDSRQFQVLSTKAPSIRDYDFWRRAQKAFRVTGFRDGHPDAIQMVLARALDAQKAHTDRGAYAGWPLLWPLYLRSVHLYLHDELPNLYSLVKREDFEASPGTLTEQILRCIVNSLPIYEAAVDEVRELYELWGFERSSYVDDILSNPAVEGAAVRRMVDSAVSTMRREVASAMTLVKTDLQRQVDQHAGEVATLRETVQRARKDLNVYTAQVSSITTIGGQSEKSLAPSTGNARRHGKQPVAVTVKATGGDRSLAAIDALQKRVEGLGRQLGELRTRLDTIKPHIATPPAKMLRAFPTATTLQVTDKWSQAFDEVGFPNAPIGSSWILLELVRRSRVILTDKPQLLISLINSLPEGEVRTIAASPLWISESDWKDGLSFIGEDVGIPRLLVVADFDVALQETYLIPALTLWVATLPPHCANRIVLTPSDSEFSSVSARVFEFATLVTHDAPHVRDLKRLGSTIVDNPPTSEVQQSAAGILSYSRSANVSHEDELRQYCANYGVILPPHVLENFVSVNDGLRASLKAGDAGFVAQQATLMPWVERARGETVARVLREALRTVLSGN